MSPAEELGQLLELIQMDRACAGRESTLDGFTAACARISDIAGAAFARVAELQEQREAEDENAAAWRSQLEHEKNELLYALDHLVENAGPDSCAELTRRLTSRAVNAERLYLHSRSRESAFAAAAGLDGWECGIGDVHQLFELLRSRLRSAEARAQRADRDWVSLSAAAASDAKEAAVERLAMLAQLAEGDEARKTLAKLARVLSAAKAVRDRRISVKSRLDREDRRAADELACALDDLDDEAKEPNDG